MLTVDKICRVPRNTFSRLFLIPRINLEKVFLISKSDLVRWIYFSTMIFVVIASLNPWFFWGIYNVYTLLASVPIIACMLLSRTVERPLFTRNDYFVPICLYLLMMFTITFLNGRNINGYILQMINATIFLSLFMLNVSDLVRLGTILSKFLACLLVVSLTAYFLVKFGFSLPHREAVNVEFNYSYTNYFFFLLDHREEFSILPRFCSVFLEPAHIGMTCICLLYCQIGQWHKWYNIVHFITIILTLSLAAWVFLVILLFSASWMKGRNIIGKVILLISLCAVVATISLYYNRGQNVINELIVQRLMINEDGELEGDNRATETFQREYKKLASSSEILTGRGYEGMAKFSTEGGNAGYRVYIYSNGLIGVMLLTLFLCTLAYTGTGGWRNKVVMLTAHFISFIPAATPLKFAMFIPWYILLFIKVKPTNK